MTLVLQGIALNDEPMSQPLIGRFDERGGTLGRSENATFTLPDPERLISRVQAQILFRDEGYWIENVSAANAILHNGRPLSAGMRILLREGDELRISGYTLRAAFENDAISATILRGRTVIMQPQGPVTQKVAPAAAETHSTPAEASPVSQPPATSFETPHDAPPPADAPPNQQPSANSLGTQPVAGDESLWRAFLEGSGIKLSGPNGLSPEFLSHVGTILRVTIEGIHRLVMLRATAKDEMYAEMTTIQIHGKNPLKSAPDGAAALQLLLEPPARGFLPGATALRHTLVELQSQLVGMTAGTRAALQAVLERFDPSQVEALLKTQSVFDSRRPSHRRAQLWDLYVEHYRSLRDEAHEDFQRVVGDAFREAYETQVLSRDAARDLR